MLAIKILFSLFLAGFAAAQTTTTSSGDAAQSTSTSGGNATLNPPIKPLDQSMFLYVLTE